MTCKDKTPKNGWPIPDAPHPNWHQELINTLMQIDQSVGGGGSPTRLWTYDVDYYPMRTDSPGNWWTTNQSGIRFPPESRSDLIYVSPSGYEGSTQYSNQTVGVVFTPTKDVDHIGARVVQNDWTYFAVIEHDTDTVVKVSNNPDNTRYISLWDVYLTAGTTYRIEFDDRNGDGTYYSYTSSDASFPRTESDFTFESSWIDGVADTTFVHFNNIVELFRPVEGWTEMGFQQWGENVDWQFWGYPVEAVRWGKLGWAGRVDAGVTFTTSVISYATPGDWNSATTILKTVSNEKWVDASDIDPADHPDIGLRVDVDRSANTTGDFTIDYIHREHYPY